MPYMIMTDHPRKRVTIVSYEPLGLADALELMDRQVADGVWPYSVLHNVREVTWIPSADEIRHLVSYVQTLTRVHGPRGPIAFVTANEAQFGTLRMYSMLGEDVGLTVEVFRDPVQAEQWLDAHRPHQV